MKSFFIFMVAIPYFAFSQCLQDVNFNNWQVLGNPNGQWFVLNESTVKEFGDAQPPTFFVSPQQLINVRITGTMRVDWHNDADFVGLVFGYQAPQTWTADNEYHFILFDWKKTAENFQGNHAEEGMTLSRVNMEMSYNQSWWYFWGHIPSPGEFEVLATNYGINKGWDYNVDYTYELTYLNTRIIIAINGDTLFNVPGCFEPGQFGFYSFSQQNSVFSNFNYQLRMDFLADRKSVCEGESIHFTTTDPDCSSFPPNILGYTWDFGDGSAAADPNPLHRFDVPGDYLVSLIVTDEIDCRDTTAQWIHVYAFPQFDLGPDTVVDYGSDLTLVQDYPGATFQWSTGETSNTLFLQDIRRDTLVGLEINSHGCSSSDEILIRVGPPPYSKAYMPNAFTPDGDGRNDRFLPVFTNVKDYRLLIFDRWGRMLFQSDQYGPGWDGKCGGADCPAGVYVWKLEYHAFTEEEQYEWKVMKGVVAVVR